MDNTIFDTTKVYMSPEKEMLCAYVNGEWKQFIRTDIIAEMEAKKLSLNPVLSDSICPVCGSKNIRDWNVYQRCNECDTKF